MLITIILLVSLLFTSLLLATFLDRARPNPWEKDIRWVSLDPYFVFEVGYVDGEFFESAFLETNGELQEVFVDYQGSTFIVLPSDTEGIYYKDRLLGGTWRYRGDKLIFYIHYDSVFNEAYKKITFEAEAITDQDIQSE